MFLLRLIGSFALLLSPLGVARQYGNLPPLAKVMRGVDVSHYQKQIEWDSVAVKEPIDFAFVKATEGHDYVDSLFCRNWDALRRHGIRRGAYHFFRAFGCGEEQARNFLQNVEYQAGDLAPVLDIERTDGIAPEIMIEEAQIWLHAVEKNWGSNLLFTRGCIFMKTTSKGISTIIRSGLRVMPTKPRCSLPANAGISGNTPTKAAWKVFPKKST